MAVLLAVCAVLCSFCSCIKTDDAREYIESFLNLIESGSYAEAEEMLHPERPADLEKFFTALESDWQTNIQSGIEIVRYTSIKTSYYDSAVKGSTYLTKMNANVGGQSAEIEIEIVKNNNGYGIYNFIIDKN